MKYLILIFFTCLILLPVSGLTACETDPPIAECNEGDAARPIDFDMTLSVGFVSVTFHVHCESEEGLLLFIATSGGMGCDIGRTVQGGEGATPVRYRNKADLLKGIERAMKMKTGTLKTISVTNSSKIKYAGKVYQVKKGEYKVERKVDYPLDFKFELEEVQTMQKENAVRFRKAGLKQRAIKQ